MGVVGRYALSAPLAAGGMATVHLGRLIGEVGFTRTVAIKRLHPQFASDPEFVSMFLDEARLAARVQHPNAVHILDVVSAGSELFLVMDYVPGESLSRLLRVLRQQGVHGVPPHIASAIACGMLHGLHAAHEATNERGQPLDIVHRDVSPQNVLVGTDGAARLLDFGVAKAAGRLQTTRDGQVKGKLAYMPPEQVRGQTLNRQTDLYAAAVVLWEMLTGERLFQGENDSMLLYQVLEGAKAAPSEKLTAFVSPEVLAQVQALDPVVMRGLAFDPKVRFATAREMALAVEKALRPASAHEVGDWVEKLANDTLMQRARLVADLESNSSIHTLTPPPERPKSAEAKTSVEGISRTRIRLASRLTRVAIGVGAVVVLALGAWSLRALISTEPATAQQEAAKHDSAPPSAPVAAPTAAPIAAPTVAPTAAPTAAKVEAEALHAPVVAPVKTPTRAHGSAAAGADAAHTKHPARGAGDSKDDCKQPYTWDADGTKHIKPDCL